MKKECYFLEADEKNENFNFFSEGPKGIIKKTVKYEKVGDYVYNLGFGDWDEVYNDYNDKVRSNNGDRDKILSTVVDSVVSFMNSHPGATILAKGATPARTRLYQMGISKHLAEISALYVVSGYLNGKWVPFEPG